MARHHLACAVSEVASFTVSFTSLSKFDIICLIKRDKLGTRCSSEIKAEPDYFLLFVFFLVFFCFVFWGKNQEGKRSNTVIYPDWRCVWVSETRKSKVQERELSPLKLCRPVETERGDGSECKHYVPFHTSDPHRCCLTLDSSAAVIFFDFLV